jgi:hypothetical protein
MVIAGDIEILVTETSFADLPGRGRTAKIPSGWVAG